MISLACIKDCFFFLKLLNFYFLLKIIKFSRTVNNESFKKIITGDSLVVQWLGLGTLTALQTIPPGSNGIKNFRAFDIYYRISLGKAYIIYTLKSILTPPFFFYFLTDKILNLLVLLYG